MRPLTTLISSLSFLLVFIPYISAAGGSVTSTTTSTRTTNSVHPTTTTETGTGPYNNATATGFTKLYPTDKAYPQPPSTGCELGALYCYSPTMFGLCGPSDVNGGTRISNSSSVAAGTVCRIPADPPYLGAIKAVGGLECTVGGQLKCKEGGTGFWICDQGQFIDMGPVAPGTKCKDGVIVGEEGPPVPQITATAQPSGSLKFKRDRYKPRADRNVKH